jgi:hypothetical protein
MESLRSGAMMLAKKRQLIFRFDTLCNHVMMQISSKADEGMKKGIFAVG